MGRKSIRTFDHPISAAQFAGDGLWSGRRQGQNRAAQATEIRVRRFEVDRHSPESQKNHQNGNSSSNLKFADLKKRAE